MRFGSGTCLGSQVFRSRWASVSAFTLCTIATLTLFVTVWRVSCGRVSCGWVSCGRVCCVHLLRLTTEGPPRTNDRLEHTASGIVDHDEWVEDFLGVSAYRALSLIYSCIYPLNQPHHRSLTHPLSPFLPPSVPPPSCGRGQCTRTWAGRSASNAHLPL